MTIYSEPLIAELKTFIAARGSYAAVLGQTDDLVSALLIATRIIGVLQTFDSKISESFTDHNEVVIPMPFIASVSFS